MFRKFLSNIKKFRNYIFSLIFIVFNKIDNKKIVCINFNGRGYGDNPKYIINELLNENYSIIWLVNKKDSNIPKQIKQVKYKSIRSIYNLETARIIITNVKNGLYFIKRKNQTIIQTWHGSFSPKYVEKDAIYLPKKYLTESKKDSKRTDMFISNSSYQSEEYISSFWCESEILECGSPRNDIFFDNNLDEKKLEIKKKLGINNEKIVLYTPTFRDDKSTEGYNINYKKIIELYDNCVFLVRMHPNVKGYKELFEWNDNVIDVTKYSDVQELLLIADVLITDYSTTMFDFLIMKKPIFLYANDVEKYNKTRGLKKMYYNLPFDICKTNEELFNSIKNYDEKLYLEKINLFMKEYNTFDNGNASKIIAKRIKDIIDGEEEKLK